MPPAPLREVDLGPLDVTIAPGPEGLIYARSSVPLDAYDTQVTAWLDRWAEQAPQRIFLAERDANKHWQTLTFAQARKGARALGQALLGRNLNPARPLVILSGNSIAHAQVALAALYVGIPYAPISPTLALNDPGTLKRAIELLTPGLVFIEDASRFAEAIAVAVPDHVEILAAADLAALGATSETPALDAAHAAVGPDTIAKFMFTSGSTARPKAVITTHRMLCANQAMIASSLRFLRDEPPVLVDWLPWHHSFGGNQNFHLALCQGGTFYIDSGRPADIAATLANLREIAPTLYFNVPRGFETLLPHLTRDRALAKNFFSRLKLAFFAGASLSHRWRNSFDSIAAETCGERIMMMSGYGATETSPAALFSMRDGGSLPLPGTELKLVPHGGKREARVKGPHVTPGYWRGGDLPRAAFDDEGYYRLGDALRISETGGFCFDGRLDEAFKLATGTWVSAAPLRERFIEAFAPYVKDLAIAGPGRAYLAALVFPDVQACAQLAGLGAHAAHVEILKHPAVLGKFRALLEVFAARASSRRIERIALLSEPPSSAAGELTDKGSLSQSAVLANRAALVLDLYAGRDGNAPLVALETQLARNAAS